MTLPLAISFVAASASGLASVLLNALVIPQQMPPLPDADADDAEEPEDVTLSNDPKTERSVEELELPQRQEVDKGGWERLGRG